MIYLLVVVEHGVHVLNPDGVDGPVKDDPLAVVRCGQRLLAVGDGQHAVRPLVADGVEAAVQLAHGDGLGVEDAVPHSVLVHQLLCGRAEKTGMGRGEGPNGEEEEEEEREGEESPTFEEVSQSAGENLVG